MNRIKPKDQSKQKTHFFLQHHEAVLEDGLSKLQFSLTSGCYLFLSCNPLLVSLSPGWVVDVKECFVSCGDSTRSEQLKMKNND